MAAAVGTIDSKTGTTGTQAYSGLGFQPKLIIFWGGNITSLDTDTTPLVRFHGADDGTRAGSCWAACDGSSVPSIDEYSTTYSIFVADQSDTLIVRANVDSFQSDGFTLQFDTVPASTAVKIHYMAFGGSTLTNVYVDTFVSGTGSSVSRTAPGFTPDSIFVIGRKNTRNGYSFGWATGNVSGDESAVGFRYRGVSNRFTAIHATDQLAMMADDSAINEMEFSLTQFDANGYTFGKDVGGTDNADFVVASMKGGSFANGYFDSPTSGAPVDESVSGLGFQPEAYFLIGAELTGTDANSNSVCHFTGASDGTNEAASWADVDTSTDEDHGMTSSKVVLMRDDAASLIEDADHKTMDSGGFTTTYTTVDANAFTVMWWAWEGAAAAGGGNKNFMTLLGVG